MFVVECGVVNKNLQCSSISFEHVSLWCLFSNPHLSASQSNLGVQLREVTERQPPAYLILVHHKHFNDIIFLCFPCLLHLHYYSFEIFNEFSYCSKQLKASLTQGTWKKWKAVGLGNINLHTRDWEPVTISLQALSLVEKAKPLQVHFTLRLRDQRSMWMQDGCKVYMNSYMASNGSCFMVTWTNFKNHFLEVGLTQN